MVADPLVPREVPAHRHSHPPSVRNRRDRANGAVRRR